MANELIVAHNNANFFPTSLFSWDGSVTALLGQGSTDGANQCSIQPGSTPDNAYIAVDSDAPPPK